MSKEDKKKNELLLRTKALMQIKERVAGTLKELPKEYLMEMLHELQVHQIELQLQNEELTIARTELEDAKEEYTQLYDYAPVAYLSLNLEGVICKANNAARQLLVNDKLDLGGRRFQKFVPTPYLSIFHAFIRKVFAEKRRHTIELMIKTAMGTPVWVLIEAVLAGQARHEDSCLVTLVDITQQKQAQEIIKANIEEKERANIIIGAQEEERRRVSEALHNSIAQSLYAMQLLIEQLNTKNFTADMMDKLQETVNYCINETRTISFELSPSILQDFGLETTIEELASKKSDAHLQIKCSFNTSGRRLPSQLETGVYRLIQELVNNIQKHSKATQAHIKYEIVKDFIKVVVEDNGVGFSVDNEFVNKNKTGLRNIKNRVLLMNGAIDFHSRPGGTSVIIEIPMTK